MANTIAIDPVTMPETTIMHFDDYVRIAANGIAFVKVEICCRSRVREGHQGTGECGLQCCSVSHFIVSIRIAAKTRGDGSKP